MELIKIYVFGLILCICTYFITKMLWNENNVPENLVKYKWFIFLIIFITLVLIEDYMGLLFNDNSFIKIILVLNAFISFIAISALKRN